MKLQAAYFFGSGISLSSGLPSVYTITDSALNGDWHITTAASFAPGANANPRIPDTTTPTVKAFLGKLHDFATDYIRQTPGLRTIPKPHYEDLFSLAAQASQSESAHAPNLAVVEFVRRLRSETSSFHQGFTGGTSGTDGFIGLAETACDYLHWVVHHKLSCPATRSGLALISETARVVDELDIFTLNHDLLVETQLEADGIADFEIGFSGHLLGDFSVYGWRNPRKKVRMFKLHGSINWYCYEFPDFPDFAGPARQYAIPNAGQWHSKDQHGTLLHPLGGKAAFLSGSIVKEQQYGFGFWGEFLGNLRSHLSSHTHLICCGYGFGDTGINQRIEQWLHDRPNPGNRLVILTPQDETKYFRDKPYWMSEAKAAGRIILVPHYLQGCTLSDLKRYFDPL